VFIAIGLSLRPGFPCLVEYQNSGGDGRAKEKLLRQPDDGFQNVLVDELLANDAFCSAAEEHAVRNNDPHAAFAFQRNLHHVTDEGIIAFAGRRQPAVEAVIRIVSGKFSAPFFQREWRIGNHNVETHQFVMIEQTGVGNRVAPFDLGFLVNSMQEHIHATQRPGRAVRFLPAEEIIRTADLFGNADQQ